MEEYLRNIFNQFALAKGISFNNRYSHIILDDFINWTKERERDSLEFISFLDYNGFRFADLDCVEVGKSSIDSIFKDFNTTILTPYANSFDRMMKSRIIEGKMQVIDSRPYLVRKSLDSKAIPDDIFKTYIMHNPYSGGSIKGWESLHNTGDNKIIIGAFGRLIDQDYEMKIKMLKSFKEGLIRDYVEEYSEDEGKYFYAIGSPNHVLKMKSTHY